MLPGRVWGPIPHHREIRHALAAASFVLRRRCHRLSRSQHVKRKHQRTRADHPLAVLKLTCKSAHRSQRVMASRSLAIGCCVSWIELMIGSSSCGSMRHESIAQENSVRTKVIPQRQRAPRNQRPPHQKQFGQSRQRNSTPSFEQATRGIRPRRHT